MKDDSPLKAGALRGRKLGRDGGALVPAPGLPSYKGP